MGVLRIRHPKAYTVARIAWAIALAGLASPGCDDTRVYPARGIVQEVALEEGQVMVDHEEIPGLMPAMTMNFAIYDRPLLESLSPGDVIEFDLTSERGSFFITAAQVVGEVRPEDGWSRLGEKLVRSDPAPDFDLTDTEGGTVSLGAFAGQAVLLDFIFTRCQGPCPALTSAHVRVQRELPPELRERVHFVSITIDPERDTPDELRAYAEARGADLSDWSFLTGERHAIEEVAEAYGIGVKPVEGGDIEHVLATFLIDPEGRIVKRYLGISNDPAEILADLRAIAGRQGEAG